MYYLNILYCNVLSEDSCPASVLEWLTVQHSSVVKFDCSDWCD